MSNFYPNKPFTLIAYSETWDRLTYYGLQSILIIYLTKFYTFTDQQSYAIYGVYVAMSFALSMVGGLIADKYLGFFRASLLGAMLIFVGNISLIFPHKINLFFGLGAIATGVGLFKPNIVSLLGLLFSNSLAEREKAFSIFYMFINLGSILGPFIYGICAEFHTFYLGFIFGSVGMLSSVLLLFLNRNNLDDNRKKSSLLIFFSLILLFIISGACSLLIMYPLFFSKILWILSIFTGLFLLRIIYQLPIQEKKSLINLIVPLISCIIFLTYLLQIFTSLMLFIDRFVNRSIAGWNIPTVWFSSVEPIFLILIAPFIQNSWDRLHSKGWKFSSSDKIQVGLLFTLMSFYLLSLAAYYSSEYQLIIIFIIIVASFLLAIGELCVMPVALSMVNLEAPQKYKGTFVGLFYFALTLSGYFSGVLAQSVVKIQSDPVSISHSLFNLGNGLLVFVVFIYFYNKIKKSFF